MTLTIGISHDKDNGGNKSGRVGRTSDRELILALLLVLLFPVSQFPFMSMSARGRVGGRKRESWEKK